MFTNLPQLPALNNGNGLFCDPQLGCSNRLEVEDLSDEHAWQFSQEFRLASNFNGPVNFSFGGNYLHYETEENYYVFSNALTLISLCGGHTKPARRSTLSARRFDGFLLPAAATSIWPLGSAVWQCSYIDPNPIGSLNNQGHNYFLSQNPYLLNSYASFGEVYYNVTKDFKLTFGGRWTEDQKHFIDIPSEIAHAGIRLSHRGRDKPAMGCLDRPLRRRLDAGPSIHRQDVDLCLVGAWLQGRRRQSTGR